MALKLASIFTLSEEHALFWSKIFDGFQKNVQLPEGLDSESKQNHLRKCWFQINVRHHYKKIPYPKHKNAGWKYQFCFALASVFFILDQVSWFLVIITLFFRISQRKILINFCLFSLIDWSSSYYFYVK